MAEVSIHAEDPEPLVAALMWGIGHSVCVLAVFVALYFWCHYSNDTVNDLMI